MSVFRILHWTTLSGVLLWGVWSAWDLRWICDDAFISFRYAEHLTDGLGLVYNAGERVEGYTNFAWTILLAAGIALGVAPEALSVAAGLLAYAASVALLLRCSLRMSRDLGVEISGLPLAALAWVALLHARVYATSGLETMGFTLAVTALCVAAIESGGSKRGPWIVGALGTLAALIRPEGALFYGLAAGSLTIGVWWRLGLRDAARAALPGAVILPAYALWKYQYYGDLLPNTYYAKSGHLAWWSQGLLYLRVYFTTYWPLVIGGVSLIVLSVQAGLRHARPGDGWGGQRAPILLAGASGLYLLHVAKVGGDFMFARFAIPVTPLLLLGLELGAHHLRGGALRPFASAATAAGLLLAPWPDWTQAEDWGFNEERSFYLPGTTEEAARQGEILREITEGLDVRVAIHGSQAMLAWYAEFPLVIEAHAGLTDRYLARREVDGERGRPGHEKSAPVEYLLERGVQFTFDYALREPGDAAWKAIDFGQGVTGRIVRYDGALMAELERRGAEFVRFERMLDSYIAGMGAAEPDQISQDLAAFEAYYFRYNEDPREAIIRAAAQD